MKCTNCGANLEDGALFCSACGASVQAASPDTTVAEGANPAPAQPDFGTASGGGKLDANLSKTQRIIVILCILVALVLLITLIGSLFGDNSKKGTVKDYYDALEDCDAEEILDNIPKDYLEDFMDDLDFSKKEMREMVQEYLDEFCGDYDDIKISFEDSEKVDDDDIEELMDCIDLDIDKMVSYDIEIRYKTDDGDVTKDETNAIAYRYNGSWYCLNTLLLLLSGETW
ncbi:MAG: zinc-ribbon domain-containing protein [Ruminococcus sp.]|nr:zinc-ribbon domain-containing protein [Ruminococcus sp.]